MKSALTPIVYLNCHDAGRFIQPFGHSVLTPNLQTLAETSSFFRNAFSAAPVCSASRAALLTGLHPHQVGMNGLAHRGFRLSDYGLHLVPWLSKLGYRTALSGIQHVAPQVNLIGYDGVLGQAEIKAAHGLAAQDKARAELAAKFIEENANGGSPFYLECGLFFPHRPYPAMGECENINFTPSLPYLPDVPEVRRDISAYAKAVQEADAALGIILSALKRTGLHERAIIIVTTDHGPAFPWAKCNLNDRGTGVFLMMRTSEHTAQHTIDQMVTHLDIRPTLNEMLGVESDHPMEGSSLVPLLNGTQAPLHDAIFSEVTYHAAYEPMRSVRTDRYRYVKRFDSGWGHPVLPNIDDGPSKRHLLAAGLSETKVEAEALYDLELDPSEQHNLVIDEAHAETWVKMASRLEAWMKRTRDPLLDGPVAAPEGAIICRQDEINSP